MPGRKSGKITQTSLIKRLRALAERLDFDGVRVTDPDAFDAGLEHLEALVGEARGGSDGRPRQEELILGGEIRIWCDGSCSPNPGPGGWGAIVEREGEREELSGAAREATNNIMEMRAAIEALKVTPKAAKVHVTTDSRYLMDGITKWIKNWKKRNWRKADGDPVLNEGLWRELDRLVGERKVTWAWVAGHSGHPENERCDELANEARLGL